jgi:hypothetical protein
MKFETSEMNLGACWKMEEHLYQYQYPLVASTCVAPLNALYIS